VENNTSGKLEN